MGQVIGSVMKPDWDGPRGPDATLRLRVAREWFERGAEVEIDVPRLLTCAQCDGGGCDLCERSGALTLRGRDEAPESIRLQLPMQKPDDQAEPASLLLRIPERGGKSEEIAVRRGHLLLRLVPADESESNVRLATRQIGRSLAAGGSEQLGKLALRSVAVALILILLYLFLLWFSGWM